ncbi:Uncharacterized protein TCM_002946 [Theobroma cacao]|uniref:Uncharacterized protein n=1 Tax=Theobroma cacao TaxID=3641 RepID=A0A061DM90_THECC|nr:Uncharacterized protein TCM_002946 [Theobroma cacao]
MQIVRTEYKLFCTMLLGGGIGRPGGRGFAQVVGNVDFVTIDALPSTHKPRSIKNIFAHAWNCSHIIICPVQLPSL